MEERYGKSLVTKLARLDGKSVGFVADKCNFKGGMFDAYARKHDVGEHLLRNWPTSY